MHISWEDAQTFLAIAESGSFSAAGRMLDVGQPAVSRRVSDLEERVGEQLFWRNRRGAKLTEAGARLLPAAQQMARWAAEFDRLAHGEGTTATGVVRVAVPPGFAINVMAPLAVDMAEHSDVQLEILASIQHLDLARGEADLAVRNRAPTDPELISVYHVTVPSVALAAKTYARCLKGKTSARDVRWLMWAAPYAHLKPGPQMEEHYPEVKPALTSDNYAALQVAMEAGLGAMVQAKVVHPSVDRSHLVEIKTDLRFPDVERHIVCTKSMRYVPRVKLVIDRLIEVLEAASK